MIPCRHIISSLPVTALVALLTAFVALGVGVWEHVQMREHNRLSVMPRLSITAEFQTIEADSVDQGVIGIRSEGVGPAVVDEVEVAIRNRTGAEHRFPSWGEVRAFLEEELDATLTRRVELGSGVMFGADRVHEVAILRRSSSPGKCSVGPAFAFRISRCTRSDLRRRRAGARATPLSIPPRADGRGGCEWLRCV